MLGRNQTLVRTCSVPGTLVPGCDFAKRRIPQWKKRQRRVTAHREALGEDPRMVPKMTSELQLVRDRDDQADLCAGRLLEHVSIQAAEARSRVSGRVRSGETMRIKPVRGTNELDPRRDGVRRRMRRVSAGAALRAWGTCGWHELKQARRCAAITRARQHARAAHLVDSPNTAPKKVLDSWV